MRDPNRIPKVLERIGKAWAKKPDLRLGQLLDNAMYAGDGDPNEAPSLFYVEDEDAASLVELFCKERK